jgi:hypothetical protein
MIQYKKGSNMPANYLSSLPGAKDNIASISAFDPFQTDLYDLQMKDSRHLTRHPDLLEHRQMATGDNEARPGLLHGHD